MLLLGYREQIITDNKALYARQVNINKVDSTSDVTSPWWHIHNQRQNEMYTYLDVTLLYSFNLCKTCLWNRLCWCLPAVHKGLYYLLLSVLDNRVRACDICYCLICTLWFLLMHSLVRLCCPLMWMLVS